MKKWEIMTINNERFEVNTFDTEVENSLRGFDDI